MITKLTHTDGPWTAEGVNIYAPAPATVRKHIAKVIYGDEPDANLIAAAPDLLDALEIAIVSNCTPNPEAMAKCRSAIAKAKGIKTLNAAMKSP